MKNFEKQKIKEFEEKFNEGFDELAKKPRIILPSELKKILKILSARDKAIKDFLSTALSQARLNALEEVKEKIIEAENRLQDTVWQIEKCGASEDLTKAVIMAGEVRDLLKSIFSK